MHNTAFKNGKLFFDTYVNPLGAVKVVEIGAQNVNGSIRGHCSPAATYVGVDFVAGNGVDLVLDDPYQLPFDSDSVDFVVSSSCLEHSEFFWLLFNEILRILKPTGVFYLNVPSNGSFHRYPVDCWRFYPDAGQALVNWSHHCGFNTILLESFTTPQENEEWNDYVAIFLKNKSTLPTCPNRMIHRIERYTNGNVTGNTEILNHSQLPEDLMKLRVISLAMQGALQLK